MMLGHLILTRHSVQFWSKRSETAWREPAWHEERLRLFFQYTFPSVAAQDVRAFKWLVFVHPETPTAVKQRLERDGGAANLHIIETPFFDPEVAARVAREHIAPEVTHLVTTTLDSDDALARSFVRQAQSHARAVDNEIINFVQGFRLIERTGALYHCRLRANPFITAVERREQAKTIWAYLPHATVLERVREVRDIVSSPLWLQVVHGGNVAATGAWGLRRAWPAELSRHLSLGPGVHLDEPTRLRIWTENVRRRLERAVANRLGPETRVWLRNRLRPRSS
jgi:Putative rhamnosyl transferase